MKITIVGNRDGKRVICWLGFTLTTLLVLAIGTLVYLGGYWLLSGAWPPLGPSLAVAAVSVGGFLGGALRHAFATPLERLPRLS